MLTDIASFLAFFDSVHRRTVRDVAALPPAAAAWQPPRGEGEAAWGFGQLVSHIGGARLYFASAYRDEGWIFPDPELDVTDQAAWLPYLERTAVAFRSALTGTPDDWLRRRIALIDTHGSISAWRLLTMMTEHEVHHRSQIDTYAGLEGWPVPQIFDRTFEAVRAQRDRQRALHQQPGGN